MQLPTLTAMCEVLFVVLPCVCMSHYDTGCTFNTFWFDDEACVSCCFALCLHVTSFDQKFFNMHVCDVWCAHFKMGGQTPWCWLLDTRLWQPLQGGQTHGVAHLDVGTLVGEIL